MIARKQCGYWCGKEVTRLQDRLLTADPEGDKPMIRSASLFYPGQPICVLQGEFVSLDHLAGHKSEQIVEVHVEGMAPYGIDFSMMLKRYREKNGQKTTMEEKGSLMTFTTPIVNQPFHILGSIIPFVPERSNCELQYYNRDQAAAEKLNLRSCDNTTITEDVYVVATRIIFYGEPVYLGDGLESRECTYAVLSDMLKFQNLSQFVMVKDKTSTPWREPSKPVQWTNYKDGKIDILAPIEYKEGQFISIVMGEHVLLSDLQGRRDKYAYYPWKLIVLPTEPHYILNIGNYEGKYHEECAEDMNNAQKISTLSASKGDSWWIIAQIRKKREEFQQGARWWGATMIPRKKDRGIAFANRELQYKKRSSLLNSTHSYQAVDSFGDVFVVATRDIKRGEALFLEDHLPPGKHEPLFCSLLETCLFPV